MNDESVLKQKFYNVFMQCGGGDGENLQTRWISASELNFNWD